ncbi:hypothetical protein E3N88_09457 [Mikania micrantha]|uniref:Uncharacterized protein n=1 Tax=Mikania micrantha TaxID=192012 RepID=A0A5N6PL27_9ASTR|nr:hypothetical protein E3N88_09457 [Mikania micrantha]
MLAMSRRQLVATTEEVRSSDGGANGSEANGLWCLVRGVGGKWCSTLMKVGGGARRRREAEILTADD